MKYFQYSYLILLLFFCSLIYGSIGDRQPEYIKCVKECTLLLNNDNICSLKWYEKYIFQWNCLDDCKYKCMHQIEQIKKELNLPIVQYYGKWPFIRIFGMQEIASVIFSICNFIPHYQYFINKKHNNIQLKYPFKNLWKFYSIIAMNSWIWSTIFHARDNIITERLDYYGSILNVMVFCLASIITTLNIIQKKKILYYINHRFYLYFITYLLYAIYIF